MAAGPGNWTSIRIRRSPSNGDPGSSQFARAAGGDRSRRAPALGTPLPTRFSHRRSRDLLDHTSCVAGLVVCGTPQSDHDPDAWRPRRSGKSPVLICRDLPGAVDRLRFDDLVQATLSRNSSKPMRGSNANDGAQGITASKKHGKSTRSLFQPICDHARLPTEVSGGYSEGIAYSARTFGAVMASKDFFEKVPHVKTSLSHTMFPLSLLLTLSSGSHFSSPPMVKFSFSYT